MKIVVVPGFFRRPSFYSPMANRFLEAGFPIQIIDLGLNTDHLAVSAEKVYKKLVELNESCDIIAHSYGGIIIKYLLKTKPDITNRIKSIIFVSVPHGGSWPALFMSMFPAARELLPIGKHIKELIDIPLPKECVNFISVAELKVWPRKNGLLKDRIDIVIPLTDHDSIINSEAFFRRALPFIKSNYDQVFLG